MPSTSPPSWPCGSNIEARRLSGGKRAQRSRTSWSVRSPRHDPCRTFNLDVAIIGVDGISVSAGLTTHHEIEAHTNRCLMHAAGRVITVADSSKLGRRGFARLSGVDAVTDLVTDADARQADVTELEQAGVRVHVVEV